MKTLKLILIMLVSIAFAACGGGSDGGTTAPAATYTISGTITGATGVSVSLSGASTATTTIAANGTYSFSGLANGTYTVTPILAGYAINPASKVVSVSGANVTGVNFTATPTAATYTISGTATGASGVTITLSGANSASVITAANGSYTISGLAAGNYTVTPSLNGYTFNPTSTPVAITSADSTGVDFVATAIPVAHTISGTVSGDIKAGVTITVSGTANATATTDTNGNYTVTGLYDGSYTLTPSRSGYVFNPSSTSVTLSGANLTGKNFTATASVAATYSLSGAVSGPYVAGVTVTLSGAGNATTTTNASGNYSFANLVAGAYTVTPSLEGYTYNPAAPSVTITNSNVTQNFSASSTVTSYSVSGTVTYNGTKTGRVYLRSAWSWGTSIDLTGTPGNYTGTYTIRGFEPGTNISLSAEMDTFGTGRSNASNPAGASSNFLVNSNLTGVNITLTDAAASVPTTPANVRVFPSSGAALVGWDPTFNANNIESATAYKVYWGTDTNASSSGSSVVLPRNDGVLILTGLTNGANYYFKVSALVGASESAPSAVFGPVTIGDRTGGNTLTGSVTFPGTATGPMLVGLYQDGVGIYFTTIANPTSPQSFTVTGVPSGTYNHFAVIDMNKNGVIDDGDITNVGGATPMVTINSAYTANLTLSVTNAKASVGTNFSSNGSTTWYNLMPRVLANFKRPVKVTLISGKGMAVPYDIQKNGWGEFDAWQYIGASNPSVGDTYLFQVTYADATSEIISSSVSGVLGTAQLPRNLAVVTNGTGGSSVTVPLFTWAAPITPPVSYTYTLNLFGNASWWYSDLPSTTLQALYNANGRANPASLVVGTQYNWEVKVYDSNGNSATTQATYTP